jgi:hypothetical protein
MQHNIIIIIHVGGNCQACGFLWEFDKSQPALGLAQVIIIEFLLTSPASPMTDLKQHHHHLSVIRANLHPGLREQELELDSHVFGSSCASNAGRQHHHHYNCIPVPVPVPVASQDRPRARRRASTDCSNCRRRRLESTASRTEIDGKAGTLSAKSPLSPSLSMYPSTRHAMA